LLPNKLNYVFGLESRAGGYINEKQGWVLEKYQLSACKRTAIKSSRSRMRLHQARLALAKDLTLLTTAFVSSYCTSQATAWNFETLF